MLWTFALSASCILATAFAQATRNITLPWGTYQSTYDKIGDVRSKHGCYVSVFSDMDPSYSTTNSATLDTLKHLLAIGGSTSLNFPPQLTAQGKFRDTSIVLHGG